MTTKHTPGPWTVGKEKEPFDIIETYPIRHGKYVNDVIAYVPLCKPNAKDNASFIAAAPATAAERDKLLQINAELAGVLSRILRAHESGNNGLVMGEAVLCEGFAILAREALAKVGK